MKLYRKKLQKIRAKKVIFEILYFVFAVVGPIVFTYSYVPTLTLNPAVLNGIEWTSEAILKSDVSKWSFSITFILTVATTSFNGIKYIKERLNTMPFSVTKQVFFFIKGALIPAALIGILIFLQSFLHGFIVGLNPTLIVNATFIFIANCVIKLFINYYDFAEASRMRKNEMIEALDEREAGREE